jgi:hypothetical protein
MKRPIDIIVNGDNEIGARLVVAGNSACGSTRGG